MTGRDLVSPIKFRDRLRTGVTRRLQISEPLTREETAASLVCLRDTLSLDQQWVGLIV